METPEQRATRERKRILFDTVAPLYQAWRQGYPKEVVKWMAETAGLGEGSAVLEVGCGTGQLTAVLAQHPFAVTAIDISAAMIEVARQLVCSPDVAFVAVPFEEFIAPEGSFDLVVSATAFHWIDPAVFWAKSARLLRTDGWLALADVGETYDDPLRSALQNAWIRHTAAAGAWASGHLTVAKQLAASGMFDAAEETSHTERVDLSHDAVLGVEQTRATYLDYDPETRSSFDVDLRKALSGHSTVPTTIGTSVTMARVRRKTAP